MKSQGVRQTVALAMAISSALVAVPATAIAGSTERVSVSSDEVQGNGDTSTTVISGDGRYVIFPSTASNLVAGDTNGKPDIFRRDRQTGTTTLVSVGMSGLPANGNSGTDRGWAISADGRYVAFGSEASNLVTGDTNNTSDAFVRDLQAGTTQRVSVGAGGAQADGGSGNPSLSADGRYVAFFTVAPNLLTNGQSAGLVLHDRQTGANEIVDVNTAGEPADSSGNEPAVSADGRYVIFTSDASNLSTDDTTPSPEGTDSDVFLRDRQTNTTELISDDVPGSLQTSLNGFQPISADGRYVAFESIYFAPGAEFASEDAFVRDRQAQTTERVSVGARGDGQDSVSGAAISGDGRYVAFASDSTNIVSTTAPNGRFHIFTRDRQAATTEKSSVNSAGVEANNDSLQATLSGNGRYVAFSTGATNLVAGDTNGRVDGFVRDRQGTGGSTPPPPPGGGSGGGSGGGGTPPPALPTCQGERPTIVGTSRNDKLKGTNKDDVIVGGPGQDKIDGGRGDDVICGEGGSDELSGGPGKDTLDGGSGKKDECDGGPGRDREKKSCEKTDDKSS